MGVAFATKRCPLKITKTAKIIKKEFKTILLLVTAGYRIEVVWSFQDIFIRTAVKKGSNFKIEIFMGKQKKYGTLTYSARY